MLVNIFLLQFLHTNKLVRFYEGADGLKTGHTDAAGYCLAATAKRNSLRLIGIVLGEENSKVRNSETMGLLDYGFNNLKMNIVKKKGEVVDTIELDKADKDIVNIIIKDDVGIVELLDNNNHKYSFEVVLDDIKLPVKKGDKVGKLVVKEENKTVTQVDLTVSSNVNTLSYFQLFINSFKDILSGNI